MCSPTLALLDRYGRELVDEASRELKDYSERWMRSEIAAIPDGTYAFDAQQEDDGVTDEPVSYHVEVTVAGDELIVDWTGSGGRAVSARPPFVSIPAGSERAAPSRPPALRPPGDGAPGSRPRNDRPAVR